ncbi:TetR/AcrR family transcriptional regulator [Williamsia sp. DF01-3]|uniref:TetR/AcrR family transcriptional regulator n=1 Tax=Williamsia sp. DF01-3 TaxID=2934157 RepID=UPI000DB74CE4|nr:TetR/AcrR family transcriptional regulator [Williamsia sp. DF01-3]MCK0515666.1 TetR/AcrR family transcriptional regulator [Williamsia sp. DF01-3]PZU00035.1 MAG: TetR/AcrR family transcriptional regulator [Gordonia sp. (in: high G+C Gram-positive bacteria)]
MPSPPTTALPDRRGRKNAATREAIIDAAEELLRSGGPSAVTLPTIAERADVALQTIYNRVGSRDAVLLAVAERAFAANRIYMDEAYNTGGTPRERILAAGNAYIRFATERPHEFRLLLDPPELPGPTEAIADLTDEQNGKLAAALRAGIADGSVRPDLNPDQTAKLLWAMLNGVLALTWRTDRTRIDPDDLLAPVADLIARGVESRPERHPSN